MKTDKPNVDLIRRTVSAPNFHRRVKFSDKLSAFHMKKVRMTMDKPVYAGFTEYDSDGESYEESVRFCLCKFMERVP